MKFYIKCSVKLPSINRIIAFRNIYIVYRYLKVYMQIEFQMYPTFPITCYLLLVILFFFRINGYCTCHHLIHYTLRKSRAKNNWLHLYEKPLRGHPFYNVYALKKPWCVHFLITSRTTIATKNQNQTYRIFLNYILLQTQTIC